MIRVPVCARVSRFVSRLCSGSRPQAAAPRCLFTGKGAVDSGLAAVLAAVESVAVFVRVCDFGFGWMVVRFVRVIRLPACARVSRVSRASSQYGRWRGTDTASRSSRASRPPPA